jgi:hypothetical protein
MVGSEINVTRNLAIYDQDVLVKILHAIGEQAPWLFVHLLGLHGYIVKPIGFGQSEMMEVGHIRVHCH